MQRHFTLKFRNQLVLLQTSHQSGQIFAAHSYKRHPAAAHVHAHQIHSFLDRNRIDFREQSVDQLQILQL